MKQKKILTIANHCLNEFPYKIEHPEFIFLNEKEFIKYLYDSPLKLKPSLTPAFVAHLPSGNLIVFCYPIIKKLMKNVKAKENFVKGIIMHELFHVWHNYLNVSNQEAFISERVVDNDLKQYFPKLAKILEKKKHI